MQSRVSKAVLNVRIGSFRYEIGVDVLVSETRGKGERILAVVRVAAIVGFLRAMLVETMELALIVRQKERAASAMIQTRALFDEKAQEVEIAVDDRKVNATFAYEKREKNKFIRCYSNKCSKHKLQASHSNVDKDNGTSVYYINYARPFLLHRSVYILSPHRNTPFQDTRR